MPASSEDTKEETSKHLLLSQQQVYPSAGVSARFHERS